MKLTTLIPTLLAALATSYSALASENLSASQGPDSQVDISFQSNEELKGDGVWVEWFHRPAGESAWTRHAEQMTFLKEGGQYGRRLGSFPAETEIQYAIYNWHNQTEQKEWLGGSEWKSFRTSSSTQVEDEGYRAMVDTLAGLFKTDEAPLRELGINLGKTYLKERLAEIDFEKLAEEGIDMAVDKAVERRHANNSGYWCHYVTKPAEKKAAKLALKTAWGTKESAYKYGRDAVSELAKPENMTKLKAKVMAAYQTAEKGQAKEKVLEAIKTHVADVVVDARYANDPSTMAAYLYSPTEKLAIKAVVAGTLKKLTSLLGTKG